MGDPESTSVQVYAYVCDMPVGDHVPMLEPMSTPLSMPRFLLEYMTYEKEAFMKNKYEEEF